MTEKNKTKTKKETSSVKKIYRSEKNRLLGGVAGGLGEYFNLDPVIIRILFVLLGLSGGGVIFYFILWLIIPNQSDANADDKETLKKNAQEIKTQAKKASGKEGIKLWFGVILIFLGICFILLNFGLLSKFFDFSQFWPLLLVAFGLVLLFRS
ncbi:MAG: PspC domain-containing protein [Patescibacteria group bacterium]|jgi:phage shock protein C